MLTYENGLRQQEDKEIEEEKFLIKEICTCIIHSKRLFKLLGIPMGVTQEGAREKMEKAFIASLHTGTNVRDLGSNPASSIFFCTLGRRK